jgi:hypothetical protein
MNQGNPPPNWYPDPKGEAELRYWDGSQWTEHTHSSQTAAQPAPAAPPPSAAPPPQSAPPAASDATAPGTQPAYQQPAYGGPAPSGPVQSGPAAGSSGGGLGKKLPLIIGAVLAVVAIGVIAAVLLGGGDDKPTDEDRVKDAAEEVITTTENSACTELATQDFLQKVTGEAGQAAVKECESETSDEPFGDSAEIEEPEITGNKAVVEAKLDGGQLDGETLILDMVEVDGDWKVDDLVRKDVLSGSAAEKILINTVLNFGSSEGPKACEYLSYTGLQRLGGKSGCEKEFASATAANYTPQDINISGRTATVVVNETRQDKTIEFKLSHEGGGWKIESFTQQ